MILEDEISQFKDPSLNVALRKAWKYFRPTWEEYKKKELKNKKDQLDFEYRNLHLHKERAIE